MLGLSKTTWVLLGLAALVYMWAIEVAAVFFLFGVLFELLTYVSMFIDQQREKTRLQFWLGGEIHTSVTEAYRLVRQQLETTLNKLFMNHDCGKEIKKISYIAIIQPKDWSDGYYEVEKYEKDKKTLALRLKVDCEKFTAASTQERLNLLVKSLERIPEIAKRQGITSFNDAIFVNVLQEAGYGRIS